MKTESNLNRRSFLSKSVTATACAAAAPWVLTPGRTRAANVFGTDEHKYEIQHDWPQLPDKYTWQTTHNVAIDKAGNLYVIHEGRADMKEHPSIFVFDSAGKFMKAFGSEFQGGGHGIEIREEDGTEFIYVAAYQNVKAIAKLDMNGNIVWYRKAPMDSGVYQPQENLSTKAEWGEGRFLPTNFAFLPDGDFLLADGYGAFYIHRYDKDGTWKSCFGGRGEGEGKFNTPHGIWIDSRGTEPHVVVCDRAHHTLQILTVDGKHLKTITGFGLPANADVLGDLLLIPELHARVTLLDKEYNVVAHIGDDVARVTGKGGGDVRGNSKLWEQGKFVHPHDACFDPQGNIYVAEWVATGRISRLRKVD
jgi:hypothetical protein